MINSIKSLAKILLTTSVRVWNMLYPYSTSEKIKAKKDALYTMWLHGEFGQLPHDSFISYPCQLFGGGIKNIFIGHHTCFQSHCVLGSWIEYESHDGKQTFTPSIVIGDDCCFGEYNQITAINKITIGNGLLTGRFVYIGDNAHGGISQKEATIPPVRRKLTTKGEIVIGNNVWIGDKVTILSGVSIGDNVIIGANSVVTKNIPSNTVVGGNPVRILKQMEICQNQD